MEKEIKIIANDINSNDKDKVIKSTISLRKLLSVETNPPIDLVVKVGSIVPRLVKFLNESSLPNLQFESAWCLTNIASGTSENTKSVVDNGAIPALTKLLNETKDLNIIEQVIWAFGCISGDSVLLRDKILETNVLTYIVNVLNEAMSGNKFGFPLSAIRTSIYTLSNLLKNKPRPPYKTINPALPVLAKLLSSNDEEVLSDTLWGLTYYSDSCTEDIIKKIIDTGISRRLVELLKNQSPSIQTPALRIVCNLLAGNDIQTQVLLNCNLIPELEILLKSTKKVIRKEACFALSNIGAGTTPQIQKILESKTIVTSLIQILQSSTDIGIDTKREAAWAISNMIIGGNEQQVDYLLLNFNCIQLLCDLLDELSDVQFLNAILTAIEDIIDRGDNKLREGITKENDYLILFLNCGGLEKLENLVDYHESQEICQKAKEIISLAGYGEEEEEDDDDEENESSTHDNKLLENIKNLTIKKD